MASPRTKKEVVVLPYEPLDGYIAKLKYRHSPTATFEEIDDSPCTIIVPVDDLRTIPTHELAIEVDGARLPTIYKSALKDLLLVVVSRDAMLRKEQVLYQSPLSSLPESFVIDRARLQDTSCRTELPLEINICTVMPSTKKGWPKRRGSRVTAWALNLANHGKGPQFPWKRKTSEDFKAAGMPASASYYVNLLAAPEELFTETSVQDVLEVWIHEDMWLTFQQAESNPAVSALQRMFVSHVSVDLLNAVVESLRKGATAAEGSVVHSLVQYIAGKAKIDSVRIESLLRAKGANEVAPYVHAAFSVNKSMSTVLEQ